MLYTHYKAPYLNKGKYTYYAVKECYDDDEIRHQHEDLLASEDWERPLHRSKTLSNTFY